MNKVSVLMSLYNDESVGFLHSCLDSLKSQTEPAEEIIIVFDGPVDYALEKLVDDFCVSLPIIKVNIKVNSGLAFALNEGLKHCSGDLIARMDTDDISSPERFEMQKKHLLSNDLDIVGTAASIINLKGEITGSRINPSQHSDIIENLWCNPFIHPSVMFKKDSIVNIGAYNKELIRRQDYELWFRAARNNLKFGNMTEKLILYRFDEHTFKKQSISLAWKQGVIGFHGTNSCQLGFFKSLLCFIPFFRAFFPIKFQTEINKIIAVFDNRS